MPGKVCLGDVAVEVFKRAGIWPKGGGGRYIEARHVPVAVLKFTRHMDLAEEFVRFISGPEGEAIFERYRGP